MYCSTCGTENKENAIYCSNDGTLLKPIIDSHFSLVKKESGHCTNCGVQILSEYNYCLQCGLSVKMISDKAQETPRGTHSHTQVTHSFSLPDLIHSFRKGALGVVIAMILMLLFSFVLKEKISEPLNEHFYSEILINDDHEIGLLDIWLITHLVSTKLNLDMDDVGNGDMKIYAGFISLLLIPLIALAVGGYVAARLNRTQTGTEATLLALGMGIIYGILLTVLSFFGGFSDTIDMGGWFYSKEVEISQSYPFIGTLWKGLLLGVLFSMIGTLFYVYPFKFTSPLRQGYTYGEPLHLSLTTMLLGLLVGVILFILSDSLRGDDVSLYAWLLLPLQIGFYYWNVAHLNTLSANAFNDEMVLKLFASDKVDNFIDVIGGSQRELYIAAIAVILLHIWAGRMLEKKGFSSPLQPLLIYSGLFAVLMTWLSNLAVIGVQISGKSEYDIFDDFPFIMIGFNLFTTFLFTLVISFVFASLGYFLSKKLSKNLI